MAKLMIRIALVYMLLTAPAAADNGVMPSSKPATAPATAETAAPATDTSSLIQMLSHPSHDIRDTATQMLSQQGRDALPLLMDAYRNSDSQESKRRIRRVMETVFHKTVIQGRSGFLGISILREVEPNLMNPRTGEVVPGVIIAMTLPDLPAQRAGMKPGDIIISVQGQPLPDDSSSSSFIELISKYAPGSRLRLGILRQTEESDALAVVVRDENQASLEGLTFAPAIPGTNMGVRVTAVTPDTFGEKSGLQANDRVTSIQGHSVNGIRGMAVFQKVVDSMQAGELARLTIRRVEFRELTLEVEARPIRYITVQDRQQAQQRFLKWWKQQGGDYTPRQTGERIMSRLDRRNALRGFLPEHERALINLHQPPIVP
jgi:C-terminal processing protease CtpA/Prc